MLSNFYSSDTLGDRVFHLPSQITDRFALNLMTLEPMERCVQGH